MHLLRFLLPFFFLLPFVNSCRRDVLDEDSSAALVFSRDTVVFDTVFTTVGSATRNFKVYNFSSKAVRISSIQLAGSSTSQFRINVDGLPVVSTGDILLRGGDSMYVFVDVTVNPNNSNSPLMIEDSVVFVTNGNVQRVILNAVGQDAHFHFNEVLDCNEVWTNDKPHVIYGFAIIPSCCKLTINAGTRVHLHKNAVLAADSCATLEVLGTASSKVTFQGDRLEPEYAEEPGQWGYIWLSAGSKNNIIDWAVIKNGSVGILCDTLGASSNPTLRITNTEIRNMALYGIVAQGTWMQGDNLLINNCAEVCLLLYIGGRYEFRHSTFANYWDISNRTTSSVSIVNWYEGSDNVIYNRPMTQCDFLNCIIDGDKENELLLDSIVTGNVPFQYKFSHCLIKTDINTQNATRFVANIFNQPANYTNRGERDYTLAPGSAAINIGDPAVGVLLPLDLANLPRSSTQPDAGAYERQ
ncbi:MAG: hypothetical protein MUC87_07770 [Bacteroidia bacterium]|jgi:hypothetical protein|nr:hypothetical protein [Bacteroidia bacterium]